VRGRPLATVLALLATTAAAGVTPAATSAASGGSGHTAMGLDCNGWSPLQHGAKLRLVQCAEVSGNDSEGFLDNGHYVGHDEPAVDFFSNRRGSGNNVTYRVRLPKEPARLPSGTSRGPVWDFQLAPTFWFGMTLCDSQSYPEGTHVCRPDSNSNIQVPPKANHAGAAFMELQFYPPGWNTSISCRQGDNRWCAALTIDSLQAQFGLANLNPNCPEPVNFAFLTHSGRPVGPPGPDQQTTATFTPTSDTLFMRPGDRLAVSMHDSAAGFVTTVNDLTTGQTGSMTASVGNGFRQIMYDPTGATCNGAPYAFHPMYATAAPPTKSGEPRAWAIWSAHTNNISFTGEIGHFESADESKDPDAGPCFPGPVIPGCIASPNGDLDFDGYSYQPVWPDGSNLHPTPFFTSSPRSGGHLFPLSNFEANLPRVEADAVPACDRITGTNCTVPPGKAKFYPWFHTVKNDHSCAWALSNDLPHQISGFGGMRHAWGPLEFTNYGFPPIKSDNFASRVIENPCR
jgi:hypothetical protein